MDQPITNNSKCLNNLIPWLLPLFLLLTIFSGCGFKVKLVGEYDAIVDKSVTSLQEQTATFFSKMHTSSPNERSYESNKEFYNNVKGKVSALIIRSEVIEEGLKRNPLTKNFQDLKLQYEELSKQHKKKASKIYFKSAEKAFNQSFRAILENILYLKWNQSQPQIK